MYCFLFNVYECFACTTYMGKPEEVVRCLGIGATDSWEVSCGCWESNQSPLEKQPVVLTTVSTLHPLPPRIFLSIKICFKQMGNEIKIIQHLLCCFSMVQLWKSLHDVSYPIPLAWAGQRLTPKAVIYFKLRNTQPQHSRANVCSHPQVHPLPHLLKVKFWVEGEEENRSG